MLVEFIKVLPDSFGSSGLESSDCLQLLRAAFHFLFKCLLLSCLSVEQLDRTSIEMTHFPSFYLGTV